MDKQRVLIVHQNFPGQFRHVARHLAARPDVELICFGRAQAPGLEGVPLRRYTPHRAPAPDTHPYLRQMEQSVLRGQALARDLQQLARHGFRPDVILAHPGWGETMYAKDIFPDARLVHLCEWYYCSAGADLDFDPEFPAGIDARLRGRTWNALHTLNLELCDRGVAPTLWQKSRHPLPYAHKIEVVHEGIATELFRPDAQAALTLPDGTILRAGEPIVTYVARNLEPYRGFHVFLRALQMIQREHKSCRAVIVGGDGVSYGSAPRDAPSWKDKLLREVSLDPTRTHFTGWIDRERYRTLLQVSAAHVYLSYPFVLSWSMLEAMSSGCALVASDTAPVREFVEDGGNGLLVGFHDVRGVAQRVLQVLSAPAEMDGLRKAARRTVMQRCGSEAGLQGYLGVMGVGQTHRAVEVAA
jgi:glycosyltransferase involved in cell wall biosynthesis